MNQGGTLLRERGVTNQRPREGKKLLDGRGRITTGISVDGERLGSIILSRVPSGGTSSKTPRME